MAIFLVAMYAKQLYTYVANELCDNSMVYKTSAQNKDWKLVGHYSKAEHYYTISMAPHWKCTVNLSYQSPGHNIYYVEVGRKMTCDRPLF